MRTKRKLAVPLLASLAMIGLLTAGCHNSSSGSGTNVSQGHSNIVLRDVLGNPLTAASTTPYSPRQTCGECHDIDAIANGYHFQQGRTDAHGAIQTADDFNGDGRDWLKSDGMYGKW